VAISHRIDAKSYTSLHTLVNDMFPPTSLLEQVRKHLQNNGCTSYFWTFKTNKFGLQFSFVAGGLQLLELLESAYPRYWL